MTRRISVTIKASYVGDRFCYSHDLLELFKEKLGAHHSESLKGQFSAIKKYNIISGLLLDHVCHLLFLSE